MTEILKNIFSQLDTDEDGLISKDEAQFAVQLLGHQTDIPDDVFLTLDPSQTGLNFDQFTKLTDIMVDLPPVQPIIRRKVSRQASLGSEPSRKISDSDK